MNVQHTILDVELCMLGTHQDQGLGAYSAWLEMQLCMYRTAFSLTGLPTA